MVSAIREFVYSAPATRVIFGAGAIGHLAREIELLGAHRALVLCTPEQTREAERIATYLGSRAAGIYAKAVMHVPIETVREARATALWQ
jgi:maleylacetate reductase